MELSIFSAATALIAAAALTWLVLRFFFGTQKATAGAMDASGERQSATITVKGGYSRRDQHAHGYADHADFRSTGDRRMHFACGVRGSGA